MATYQADEADYILAVRQNNLLRERQELLRKLRLNERKSRKEFVRAYTQLEHSP